jgi:hypothetical protein
MNVEKGKGIWGRKEKIKSVLSFMISFLVLLFRKKRRKYAWI